MAEKVAAAPPPEYRELIARLPRTFGPSVKDQLATWELLFPAEQRQLRGQLEWLSKLREPELQKLFAPVTELEGGMELPKWDSKTTGLSVEDSGIIARSPLYPKWREAVGNVFAAIDEGVGPAPAIPRLIACILPAGLPVTKATQLWPQLTNKQGTWISLDRPVGEMLPALIPSLIGRKRGKDLEDVESTWVFEHDGRVGWQTEAVVLDWKSLEPARRAFLDKLNAVKRDLKSVDGTNADLKRMEITKLLPEKVGGQPRIREFVRNLFLSGNGSLVFPSSFIQWGASEAMRRAQPQVMLTLFGMRQKLKMFSSSVLFEDQHRNNPSPDEDDPAGSLVDDQILAEYVYLTGARVAAYQKKTLGLLALAGMDRVLLVGELPDGLRGTMKTIDFAALLKQTLERGL